MKIAMKKKIAMIKKIAMKKKIVVIGLNGAVLAVMLVFTLIATGAVYSAKSVSSTGVIAAANIGVFSDSACTQSLTSINWGTISPGNSVTRTVYVKNLGTTLLTLSMTGANWNPTSADGPITVTWNREGTILGVNHVATATLTLRASSGISGITTFNVDIMVTGNM